MICAIVNSDSVSSASISVIYEMSLKKGNLEDIFIELSETADAQALQDETEETPEESEVDEA